MPELPPPPPIPPDPAPSGSAAPAENSSGSLEAGAARPLDPQMFPPRHRPWKQLLADHNPCLLLSTVLMLAGCYLVNSTIDGGAGDGVKLFTLLGVINLYEFCIIPLGLLLIRRTKGVARDGLWLILFETLFLVNGTFINVEPSPTWGWTANVVLLVLACVKAAVVLKGLGIRLTARTYGFLAVQLAVVYGLPVVFTRGMVAGRFSEDAMYALYWLVGLLPVAYDLVSRMQPEVGGRDLVRTVIRRTYLIVPWLLLVAHLGYAHWAHRSTFSVADVAPLLLGVSIAALRVKLPPGLRQVAALLPIGALVLSLFGEPGLGVTLGTVDIPAPLATLIGAAMAYAYRRSLPAALVMAGAISCVAGIYLVRLPLLRAIEAALGILGRLLTLGWSLLPASAAGWGTAAIAGAFVLLGVGARMSLKHREDAGSMAGGEGGGGGGG